MNPPVSPTQSRLTAVALLLAGSVGVPSLVALFKPDIAPNPKTAILLLVLWELLVLVGSIFAKVWGKLESRLVDHLADWVVHSLQAIFSRYRRRYLDWIFYRHRDFDVKGLTTQSTYNLELEQVFVDLTIQPPPPGGTPADPIRPFPKELTGRRSIWDYLTSESLTDHLALIGPPGSGKTTLLKKIALQMTGRHRPKIRQKLPILLFLREHTEAILAIPAPSLADVASADLARKQSLVLPPAAWFKSRLAAGRCLVLLDGLDEVASQEIRQKVIDWVETQFKAFPKNRFLISSRPHGYRSTPVPGMTVLEIQPFNRDQVRQFVQNWYRANEIHASGKLDPGVEMKASDGAEDLLRRLGNSQTLTDLAVNPLLLTMIATVHRFRSSLPGRRVELYAEICEVFLGKRQKARGVEDALTPTQKQLVLQPLAHELMCTKKREISTTDAVKVIAESLRRVAVERSGSPEEDFLKSIEDGSGLLLERESRIYNFAHLAFQEYLTAVHIRESSLGEVLVAKVADPWWHEVIRLYGAQGDASGILAACLSSESPSVAQLSLAIDCLEEARAVDPKWRTSIDGFLREGAESTEPDRFHLAAETMLARRLRNMIAVSEGTFVDPNYISHAEYQLFLDAKLALDDEFYQPDHWLGLRFPKGQASTSAVGMRLSDAAAFCDWLSVLDSAFNFRLPQPGELERYGLSTSQSPAGNAAGFWTTNKFEGIDLLPIFPQSYLKTIVRRDFSEGGLAGRTDQDLDFDLDFNLGLDRELDFSGTRHDLNIAGDSAFARDFIRVLERDLERDLERALERGHAHNRANRRRARILALSRIRAIRNINLIPWRGWLDLRSWFKFGENKLDPFRDTWLRVYGDLVILEARIDGILPAIEGIRIIKERS